jgi:hypothetical protein
MRKRIIWKRIPKIRTLPGQMRGGIMTKLTDSVAAKAEEMR